MTKLTPKLEEIAIELANTPFDGEKISAATTDLNDTDADAVIERAAEIKEQDAEAEAAEADTLRALSRLAHASGCPRGTAITPWLLARGLIELGDDGRYRIKPPGPAAA